MICVIGGSLHDYLLSVVLGIIEGLTEFLPVSSTAHLRISEALLHISLTDGYWKMYSIVIQLGAILCLPVYFRERIAKFLSTFPRGENEDRTALTHPLGLTLIAFLVTAIPAFLLSKVIGKNLESLTVMGLSLLVGGLVMWVVDVMHARAEAAGPVASGMIHTWKMEAMSLGQAVWIGACQILSAVFPGTSRSMATIAGGQVAGMSRASALNSGSGAIVRSVMRGEGRADRAASPTCAQGTSCRSSAAVWLGSRSCAITTTSLTRCPRSSCRRPIRLRRIRRSMSQHSSRTG